MLRARINAHTDMKAGAQTAPQFQHEWADGFSATLPIIGVGFDIQNQRLHPGSGAGFYDDRRLLRYIQSLGHAPGVKFQARRLARAHPLIDAADAADRHITVVILAHPIGGVCDFHPDLAHVWRLGFDVFKRVADGILRNGRPLPMPYSHFAVIGRRLVGRGRGAKRVNELNIAGVYPALQAALLQPYPVRCGLRTREIDHQRIILQVADILIIDAGPAPNIAERRPRIGDGDLAFARVGRLGY